MDLYEGEECVQRDAPMATLTKRYTDSAIEFMRRKQDQPFFIYLPHSMVHTHDLQLPRIIEVGRSVGYTEMRWRS